MRNVTIPALAKFERAKAEVEYDQLLDAVRAAVAPAPQPKATNDNELAWPLIQFPEGWCAG